MESGNRAAIGELLRVARLAKGWKASKLAAVLGVSETTVSRWENGHQKPSGFHCERVCEILKLSPSVLETEGADRPAPQVRVSHLENSSKP